MSVIRTCSGPRIYRLWLLVLCKNLNILIYLPLRFEIPRLKSFRYFCPNYFLGLKQLAPIMLMLVLGVAIAAALFYYFIVTTFNYWTERGVKQQNILSIFGGSWRMLTRAQNIADMVKMAYNRYPGARYSGMYQFFTPVLVVKDPDLLKQLTVKDFDHFTDHRSLISEDVDPLWSKNLISLKGQSWREMRAILSPSFTSSKMKAMFVLMADCAENFVEHFKQKNQGIITVEMKDVFTRFTNDVIATTAFGAKVDSLGEPHNQFYLMGKDATDFSSFWKTMKFMLYFLSPKLCTLLNIKLFNNEVSNFFMNIVTDTIKMREEKGIIRPDMIHLLMEARKGNQKLENGTTENGILDAGFATAQESDIGKAKIRKELTDIDMAAQCLIFFFAGFDTVSSLMCFTSYELAVNQDVQDRLRQEICATFEEYNGKLTYEGLVKMKYMDMVVSESLRKWPSAIAVDRVCTKPYTIQPATPDERPLHLDVGDVLWLPIFGMHRDPQHFPDPDRFDPERFSDENKGNIKPYTYFPFGLGPRNCIGSRFGLLETKILFFNLLRNFEIVPVEKTRIPLKISTKTFNLNAEGGFWFGLKPIKT